MVVCVSFYVCLGRGGSLGVEEFKRVWEVGWLLKGELGVTFIKNLTNASHILNCRDFPCGDWYNGGKVRCSECLCGCVWVWSLWRFCLEIIYGMGVLNSEISYCDCAG